MTKSIIFANGIIADPQLNRQYIHPDDTIICADGGTRHALALGITPHTIIGDLDSLPTETVAEMRVLGVEIIEHPPKKNETDLELALSLAVERGATEILLLSMLGGRLDQHLANIMLLTRPEWAHVRLQLAEGTQQAWLLRGKDSLTLHSNIGDTFSIVTLSPQISGVTLSGTEWTLENATIGAGSTRTISNTFVDADVTVSIESGIALIITIKNEISDW